MFVTLKAGPRAGQVVEMKFIDAQALLADGRAEKYPPDPAGHAPIEASAKPAEAPTAVKRKGKKR